MNSIRRHLLIALLGAMFVVMLLGGWATYSAAREEAGALFDYQLKQIALSLRDQTFQGSAEALARDESLDYVIRVWDLTGLTVYFSQPHQSLPELTRLGYSTADTREGAWRVFAIQHHGMTIAVGQPMRVRNQLAAEAAWSSLKPFFVLLPVLGFLIWILVSRGLRPLSRLAQSVKARTPDSLDPLGDDGVPDEVKPLVGSLNDLLSRLKGALDAQRAFVADAAHELRTPLTALQLQVQLVERAGSDEERTSALADLKLGLQRSSHAVQQLLTLARQEPGAAEYRVERVNLAQLVRDCVVAHEQLAEARHIDLGITHAEDPVQVCGDYDALGILLANLVSNALRFTPHGGRIDVACGIAEDVAFVDVGDSGPGIPASERERVFDRFYRRDSPEPNGLPGQPNGHHGSRGSGLGLSIVRSIANRHGATVTFADSPVGGLLARLEIPLASGA